MELRWTSSTPAAANTSISYKDLAAVKASDVTSRQYVCILGAVLGVGMGQHAREGTRICPPRLLAMKRRVFLMQAHIRRGLCGVYSLCVILCRSFILIFDLVRLPVLILIWCGFQFCTVATVLVICQAQAEARARLDTKFCGIRCRIFGMEWHEIKMHDALLCQAAC